MTSTNTLLFGTTICSCLVGMGGFLYWRRAFWICCLTSSRAASSVGACAVILGKSGTWAVQPSGDKVQSTGYEKHKIRMTQMTLNRGYGIGISPKQRHKRHLRHYRHRKNYAGGAGGHPRNALVDIQTPCLSKSWSAPAYTARAAAAICWTPPAKHPTMPRWRCWRSISI